MKLSIVIPSRNGWELLKRTLPAVIRALPGDGEIIVVDDCSTDLTMKEGTIAFPDVRFIRRTGDTGFCHAVNLGMSVASGDLLMLLNNDIEPRGNAFEVLEEELESSPDYCCAAVPVIRRPDGSDESGMVYSCERGLAKTSLEGPGVLYPSGACSLWRRQAWEILEGLDTVYAPIYWEDVDIGARAFQRGMKVLRVGNAEVLHDHAATMGHSPESMALRERNRLIFTSRHFRNPPDRISRAFWIPLHLLKAALTGNRAFLKGYRDFTRMKGSR